MFGSARQSLLHIVFAAVWRPKAAAPALSHPFACKANRRDLARVRCSRKVWEARCGQLSPTANFREDANCCTAAQCLKACSTLKLASRTDLPTIPSCAACVRGIKLEHLGPNGFYSCSALLSVWSALEYSSPGRPNISTCERICASKCKVPSAKCATRTAGAADFFTQARVGESRASADRTIASDLEVRKSE